jgi:uncharacterized protein (TIGR02145 family)
MKKIHSKGKVSLCTFTAILAVATTFTFTACDTDKGTLTDSRDGKKYKIIKIGTQTWMSENLSYEAGGKCYDNNPENCKKYGRLYNWETAIKVCPSGWHLPSNEEWDKLCRYADGTSGTGSPYDSKIAGKFLKAKEGWDDDEGKSGNGTDDYGFSALPGGFGYSDDYFDDVGYYGYWWSSSESSSNYVYYRYIYYYDEYASYYYGGDKSCLRSVRCVRD